MLPKRRPARSSRLLKLKSQSRKLISTKSSDSTSLIPQTSHPFSFRNNLLKVKNQHNKQQIIHQALYVTNKELLQIIKIFQLRQGVIYSGGRLSQQKKPIIVSYIQEFSEHYSKVLKQIKKSSNKVKWILICKAVNSRQLQHEFNRRYQHFDFIILPNVFAVVNTINFSQVESYLSVSFQWFRAIINFQAYENQNPAIIQKSLAQFSNLEYQQNELWLVNDTHVSLLPKIPNFLYYFLDDLSLQVSTIKLVPTNAKLVYVALTNNTKIMESLSKMNEKIGKTKIKYNLLKSSNIRFCQKLAQSYLLNQQVYCLIGFPPNLVSRFAQKVDWLITAKQHLKLQKVKMNFLYYDKIGQQNFMQVIFDKNAEKQEEIQKAIQQCKYKRKICTFYQNFAAKCLDYKVIIFHYIGNERLHKQLQYLLTSNVEIVEEIQCLFKRAEQRMIIIGIFSKIQKDSLQKVTSINLINLKQVQSDIQSKHSKITTQLAKILNKQDNIEKCSLFQYMVQDNYMNYHIFSDINSHEKQDTFLTLDQMRCHSTPNLKDLHYQVYIIVPKTIPCHSLLNRSVNPYNLLLYGNLQEVRQLINYLDKHSYVVLITSNSQKPGFLPNIKRQNLKLVQLQELSQKSVRNTIDQIIERQCLILKKGSISKSKKGTPALLLFDQNSIQQAKLVSLMNKIFKKNKIISMSKLEYKYICSKYYTCQLQIYQLGSPQFVGSSKLTNPLHLFSVYMSPAHSYLQFTSQHLHFSSKIFWIKYYKQNLKKERIKGRLNNANMHKVQSPRSKSLKNISFYASEKGMTIMYNQITFDKFPKTKRFNSKKELISILFNQINKGNHVLVILNEKEYKQIQQICSAKPEGILWVIILKSQNFSIIREPTVVFCALQQLQSVIISITQKFRRIKHKQFKQAPNHQAISSLDPQNFIVFQYQNWKDFNQNREKNEPFYALSIINEMSFQQIDVKQIRNAIMCSNGLKSSLLLHKQPIKNEKSLQSNYKSKKQRVIILLHLHNAQFIIQCLKILKEEDSCILVTYGVIENVLLYAQLAKTIVIMQEAEDTSFGVCLYLAQHQTPFNFSSKLAAFIQSVRKST